MTWGTIWLLWAVGSLLLVVASFAVLERLSWDKGKTLSHTMATAPRYVVFIVGWMVGGLTCGLCVHFWWHWSPL